MRHNISTGAALFLAGALLVLAYLLLGRSSAPPPEPEAMVPVQRSSVPTTAQADSTARPTSAPAPTADVAQQKEPTKGEKIDAYVASGKPGDAFEAFWLLNYCWVSEYSKQ